MYSWTCALMQTLLTRHAVLTGVIVGAIIRLWMAHGDWSLFFNPWFNAFSGAKPWF